MDHGLSVSSVRANWISTTTSKDDSDGERDGWGKPGVMGPAFGPIHSMDDDDELPSYNASTGPMGLLSPTASMPSPLFLLSDNQSGKRAGDEASDDDLDGGAKSHHYYGSNTGDGFGDDFEDDHHARQSPDLSSCASDGSTSATANASPDVLGPQRSGYPLVPVELSSMSSMISREGGRIDQDLKEEGEGVSAGILAPSELLGGDETEGDEESDGEGDEVNLVTFQGPGPRA